MRKIRWPDLQLPPINLYVVHRLYILEEDYLPYKDPEKEKEGQDKYKAHTEEQRRAYHIMSKYGLFMGALSIMLHEQRNKCAIEKKEALFNLYLERTSNG